MIAIDLTYDSSSHDYIDTQCGRVEEVNEQLVHSKATLTRSGLRHLVQFPVYGDGRSASIPHQQFSKEYNSLYTENPWIVEFYSSAKTLDSVSKLLPYYKNINEMLGNQQYQSCNTFLKYVHVENLSDVLLVGLLRLTYSWANELPQWNIFLSQCSSEIANRGQDPRTLLKGLTQQNGNTFPV